MPIGIDKAKKGSDMTVKTFFEIISNGDIKLHPYQERFLSDKSKKKIIDLRPKRHNDVMGAVCMSQMLRGPKADKVEVDEFHPFRMVDGRLGVVSHTRRAKKVNISDLTVDFTLCDLMGYEAGFLGHSFWRPTEKVNKDFFKPKRKGCFRMLLRKLRKWRNK